MSVQQGNPGTHSANTPLPNASMSSEGGVSTSDSKDSTELLAERLAAWKDVVEHLQNYVESAEKVEKAHAKECEKMLKTISSPLKYGQHFDQGLGGVAGMFESMKVNTQTLTDMHIETEKNIKSSVMPVIEKLFKDIKQKSKDLSSGASKNSKKVEKARLDTQKHIELLGQHSASFESIGSKGNAMDDPYVLHQGIQYRLNKQVLEENNHRHDLIAMQNNFSVFEKHIIEIIQQVMATFTLVLSGQSQKESALYSDMLGTAKKVPPNYEWEKFVQRNGNILVDPTSPDRDISALTFPNQNHHSTKPLIAGTLLRKSRNKLSLSGHSSHYYVVTPSKFLHEYKDADNIHKDPEPDMSIYLPDAVIGATSSEKFNVKGKDVSKGLTSKLSGTSEIAFKAHSSVDAQKWFEVIRSIAGSGPVEPYTSPPESPINAQHQGKTVIDPQSQVPSGIATGPAVTHQQHAAPVQTGGVVPLVQNNSTVKPVAQAATVPTNNPDAAVGGTTTGLAGNKL